MTNNHEPWHYYVGYEDGEEMVIEYYDYIFEALASYHEAINEGPEEFNLVEVEVGRYDLRMLNMEPIEYYLFSDSTRYATA